MSTINIYTDGAARGNPGPGGYGVILMFGSHRKELSKGYRLTTNNRMELLAVITALEALTKIEHPVHIYSDSQYVVRAISEGWLNTWIKTNFKGGKKNSDLWKQYYNISRRFKITMHWVKGHATNPFNNRCDELATAAADGKDLAVDEWYEVNEYEKNNNTLCSWSGGKDSCFALMQAIKEGYKPAVLLNVLNEAGQISRSHGIPAAILQLQANAAGLPINLIASSWTDYEVNFTATLQQLKQEHDLNYAVFGDIDLQPHRDWEEKVCNNAGLTAVLPLWQQDREQLVMQMLDAGIKTIIVSCNETLGPDFLGRLIDEQCVADLKATGVDVCGENGEFHTLVLDCPLFNTPVEVEVAKKLLHEKYWFAVLEPK